MDSVRSLQRFEEKNLQPIRVEYELFDALLDRLSAQWLIDSQEPESRWWDRFLKMRWIRKSSPNMQIVFTAQIAALHDIFIQLERQLTRWTVISLTLRRLMSLE